MKIKAAIAGILALFAVASASAQQFPTVPDRTVIGRIGVGGQSGPSQAIPFANFLANVGGSQSANTVWAGPASGAAVGPTFRALVPADLPAASTIWRTVAAADPIVNTDCWKTVALGGNVLFAETLPAVAGFPAGCRVRIKNTDVYTGAGTGRGKQLIGFPTDLYPTLYPQQVAEVQIVNGAWVTTQSPGRWFSPQQVTICADVAGSNTTGDGLAASGAGCLRNINKAASVIYNQLDAQNQMPLLNVTGAGSFNEQLFAGGQNNGVNVFQIQSTGGAFTWTNAALCVDLGDNAEIVFQGPINWACNTGNSAGQAAIYGHNNAIFDLVGTHAATGGGANDSFIFCDGPCVLSTTNGFTLAGTFGDAVHFDAGGKGSFSGTIAPTSAPTVGRLFNLRYGATAILGTAPTNSGYTSLGASLVSTQSVLQTNGLTVPGGAIVPTTGGQVCTTLTACFGAPGTTTNDNATAGYPGEYISTGSANSTATITVTIATPAVVTWTAHGFVNSPIDGNTCTPINFTTTGALPTGIVAGSTYYVIPSSITTNTFQIANSVANCLVGTTVNTSGSQSGVQTGINNASIATGVAKDITGLSLTAGDWKVCGLVSSNVAGGTVISLFYGYLTTVSNTNAAVPNNGAVTVFQTAITAGGNVAMPVGCKRYSLASTTTIYLGTLMNFSSTNAAYGFMSAERRR